MARGVLLIPMYLKANADFLTASLASCHNCTLLPETSCEFFNSFLDRSLLFGNSSNPDIAFFESTSFS